MAVIFHQTREIKLHLWNEINREKEIIMKCILIVYF